MSREVRRVPLDFDWPHGERWHGFLRPDYLDEIPCEPCEGRGYSPAALDLHDLWYGHLANGRFRPEDNGSVPYTADHPIIRARAERNVEQAPDYYIHGIIPARVSWDDPVRHEADIERERALGAGPREATPAMREDAIRREAGRLAEVFNSGWCHHLDAGDVEALLAADRLWDFTRHWSREHRWQRVLGGRAPTPQEVNDWSLASLGHDSINCHIVVAAKCRRAGVDPICALCNGDGSAEAYPGQRAEAEAWQATGPPAGDGWQLWESVTEGSPISPVFATAEDLAAWISDPGRDTSSRDGECRAHWMPYPTALQFVRVGYSAGTGVVTADGIEMSGAEYVGMRK